MSETLTAPSPVELAKQSEKINLFEKELIKSPRAPHQPVFQKLAGGIIMRTIRMQPGLRCTSKIHRKEHHFIVSRGLCEMYSEETGLILIDARQHPILGITKPGTRRAFNIIEETYFTLYCRTDCEDITKVFDELIEPFDLSEEEST